MRFSTKTNKPTRNDFVFTWCLLWPGVAGARGDSNMVWHGGHYNIVSGLDSLRSDELGWRKLERDDTGDTRDPGADNTSHVIITGHQAQQVGAAVNIRLPEWLWII